jgi:REP element-mobilizing transposase RayT
VQSDPVVFKAFDRQAGVDVSVRNLPHWYQPDTATFVTFRTADSLPREVLLRWRRELEQWLVARNLPLTIARSVFNKQAPGGEKLFSDLDAHQQREFKKLSDRIFHKSLDECHGQCQLKLPEAAAIVARAILFYDSSKYDLDSFVIMPNHVHVIAQFRVKNGFSLVSESWMRYTARQIHAAIGGSGPFWQSEPFDHLIRSEDQFFYLQNYIRENPSKANLKPNEFQYWSRPV